MVYLTPIDVARIVLNAGFQGDDAITALAVALAEGGGSLKTEALSPSNDDGSQDRGLWQINNVAHAEVTDDCAYDPPCAASQVFFISKTGRGWGDWTTYRDKDYLKYWDTAKQAVETVQPKAPQYEPPIVSGPGSPASNYPTWSPPSNQPNWDGN